VPYGLWVSHMDGLVIGWVSHALVLRSIYRERER